MAVVFVQGTGIESVGSVASLSKQFTSNVTAGNAIAVGAVTNTHSLTATSASDDNGGSYTRAVDNDATAAGRGACAGYYALGATGGITTVIGDPTGSDFISIVIAEFSGVSSSGQPDGTGTASANSTTYTISAYTPTDDGVAFGVMTENEGATTFTPNNNQVFEDESVTNAMPINGQYKLTTGTGDPGLAWTLGAGRNGCACGFNLKQTAASGGTVCHLATIGGWVF